VIASPERTGHDFEFEFLDESDFRGVVTV
jgi:hypothetical protein